VKKRFWLIAILGCCVYVVTACSNPAIVSPTFVSVSVDGGIDGVAGSYDNSEAGVDDSGMDGAAGKQIGSCTIDSDCPGTVCFKGSCVNTCALGFLNCDQNVTNGCEINAATDVNNCGLCGWKCDSHPHADTYCVIGACHDYCNNGYFDCNGSVIDGCETNLSTDDDNCGECGITCSADQTCSNGSCVPLSCYAVSLDTPNSRIEVPVAGWNLGLNDWTLELWIKAHDAFGGGFVTGNYAYNSVWMDYSDTTGEISCHTYGGGCPCGKGTGNLSLTSGPINDGAWHHIACVRTGGTGTLYVDGVKVATDIVTTMLLASSNIVIGQPAWHTTSYTAAPLLIGPYRFSRVARYIGTFVPRKHWSIDASTVTQYLTVNPFSTQLVDEAGGDNTSVVAKDVSASADTPCSLY